MVDVNARFRYEGNFGPLQAQIKALTRDISLLNASFVTMDKNAMATRKSIADSFSANISQTGQFKTALVDLTSSTEQFGQALQKNRLTLRQYFTEARRAYAQDSNTRRLAQQQVRMLQSQIVDMGEGPGGRRKGMVITPLRLDTSDFTTKMQLATQQYAIFNKLVQDGATQLINWGKNTQWAGRQLTVGLTVPLTLFGVAVSKTFRDVDKELTRFAKVYGADLVSANKQATEKMKQQVQELAVAYSSTYGIAAKETIALAADIAATGREGQQLLDSVAQTTRLATLGEVDRQEAMQTTLSLQSAFKMNTKELADAINFLNAVENQTSTSLQDFTSAIPKAGPVVRALGGDIKDLALMLTAMREGGIPAAESANALKSGLASMINPTKAASERLMKLGVDIQGIVNKNRGELMPTLFEFQGVLQTLDSFARAKVIEELFGKYQFARISALFDNLNRQGSQTAQVMDLMSASSADLAKVANQELNTLTESVSMRFTRAIEGFKAALLPIGEVLTTSVIPFIEGASNAVGKMVEIFNNLPAPIKNGTKLLLGLTAVAGPLIMLTGVFANFIGYAVKGTMSMNNFARRLMGLPVEKFELLDEHTIAAAKATDILTASFSREADSLKILNQQLINYAANLRKAAATSPAIFIPGSPARPVRRSTGGDIPGYGGGDTVPALLEPGEFVVRKQVAQRHKPFLRALNAGRVNGYAFGDEVVAEPGMSGGQAPRGMRRDLIHPSQHDAMRQIIDQIARRTGIILTEGQLRTFGQINLTHAQKDVRNGIKWFDPNNLLLASGLENNAWEQLTGARKKPRPHLISVLDSMARNDPSLASVRDSIIARDPVTGQVTDMRQPRNPEQMRMVRAAIQQLLDDPDQSRIWGPNWRRESRRSRMVPIFMEILNERIGDRRAAGTRGLLTPQLIPILEARRMVTHGPSPYSQEYLARSSITGDLGTSVSRPRTMIGAPATDRRSRPGATMTIQQGGMGGSTYRPGFGRFGRFPGARPGIQYGGIPSLIHRGEAVVPLGPFGRSGFAVDSAGNVSPIDLDEAQKTPGPANKGMRASMGGNALMNIGFAGSMLAGMTAMNGEVTSATTALTAFTTALMLAGTAIQMGGMFGGGPGGKMKGAGFMGLGGLGRVMQAKGTTMSGMGGMKGLLGTGLLRGGMGVAALGGPIGIGIAAAIATVTLAIVQYNNVMNQMKANATAVFDEPAKSAEYFGIELGRSAERAEEFNEIVESLGMTASLTADQIDEDFISRVGEDYGDLINRIKGSQDIAQVGNDLKLAYSSMIAQGFGKDEALAIVEEVARQAEQKPIFLKIQPELQTLGDDPEKIADNIVKNTVASFGIAQKQIAENIQDESQSALISFARDLTVGSIGDFGFNLFNGDQGQFLDFAGAWEGVGEFYGRMIDPTKRFSTEMQAALSTVNNAGETLAGSFNVLLEQFKQFPQETGPAMDSLLQYVNTLDPEQIQIFSEKTRESLAENVADPAVIAYFDSLGTSAEDMEIKMKMAQAASLGLANGLSAIMAAEGKITSDNLDELIQKVILLDNLNQEFDESLQEGIDDFKKVQKDLNDSYDDKIKGQEKYIKGLNKEAEAAQEAYEATMDALDDEADALDDRADKIRENAEEQQKLIDKQIKYLELKQEEADFDAQQRSRAFGMIGALAAGDFAGYQQARLEYVQAQEDRTRELAIQGLQDKRDQIGEEANEKLDAIEKEKDAINDRREAAADAHEAYMKQNQENIEAAEKRIQKLEKEKVKYSGVIQEQINLLQNAKEQGFLTEKQVNDINSKLRTMGIKLPESTKKAIQNVSDGLFGAGGEYTKVVNGLITEMANALNVSEADVRAMLGNTLTGQFAGTPSSTGQNGTWWSRTVDGYTNRTGQSPIPGRASGGKIDGPGTPTSDSILARLSRGEYVIKADSVNRLGVGTLDHINATGSLPGYADGGYTGGTQQAGGFWGTGPNAMTILSIKALQDLYTTAVNKINSTGTPTSTTIAPGEGSQWLANFLSSMGLSGEQLRVAYAIAMRESSGRPNLVSTMDGNGYGLFQIQFGVGHANTLNTVLGANVTDNESDRQKFAQLMFDPINNFKVMMHMSRNMEDLGAWGLHSWRNPSLNTRDYSKWTASQHQAWIMEPFLKYYASFPGVDPNYYGSTTTSTTTGAGSTAGQAAVNFATSQQGKPYSMTASPPSSWDCSKLTAWAWAVATGADPNRGYYDSGAKVRLTPYSHTQANEISKRVTSAGPGSNITGLQPGDILYFRGMNSQSGGHTSMYVGNGQVFEAASPQAGLKFEDANNSWNRQYFAWAGPPIGYAEGGLIGDNPIGDKPKGRDKLKKFIPGFYTGGYISADRAETAASGNKYLGGWKPSTTTTGNVPQPPYHLETVVTRSNKRGREWWETGKKKGAINSIMRGLGEGNPAQRSAVAYALAKYGVSLVDGNELSWKRLTRAQKKEIYNATQTSPQRYTSGISSITSPFAQSPRFIYGGRKPSGVKYDSNWSTNYESEAKAMVRALPNGAQNWMIEQFLDTNGHKTYRIVPRAVDNRPWWQKMLMPSYDDGSGHLTGLYNYALGGFVPSFEIGTPGGVWSAANKQASSYFGGTPTSAYSRPSSYYYSTPAWTPYNKGLKPQYQSPVPTGRIAGTRSPFSTSGAFTADTAAMYSQNYSHKLPAYATTGNKLSYLAAKAQRNFGDTTGGRKWRQIASMLASPYNTPAKQRLTSASRGIPTTEYWRTLSREQKDWLIRYATTGKGTGWTGAKPFRIMPWIGKPQESARFSGSRFRITGPDGPTALNAYPNTATIGQDGVPPTAPGILSNKDFNDGKVGISNYDPNKINSTQYGFIPGTNIPVPRPPGAPATSPYPMGWDTNTTVPMDRPAKPSGSNYVWDPQKYMWVSVENVGRGTSWGWPWNGRGTKDNASSPIKFKPGMTPTTTRTSPQERYPIGMSGVYLGQDNYSFSVGPRGVGGAGSIFSLKELGSENLSPRQKLKLAQESYGRSLLSEYTGLTRVSRGEYIIGSEATRSIGVENLDRINYGKISLDTRKNGGLIGGPKFKVPRGKQLISPQNNGLQNIRGGDMIEYNINIDVAETDATADEIANKVMRQLKVNENSRRLRSNG